MRGFIVILRVVSQSIHLVITLIGFILILRFLIMIHSICWSKKMGVDRLMFGTDYPFPLGEQEMGQLIKTSSSLSDINKQKLLAGNAEAFFGI